MKELILIQGADRSELESLLQQVAQQLDPYGSISSLKLFATGRADTFAVRPNRLCAGWDFSDLCSELKEALVDRKDISVQAWFQLSGNTMKGLPAHQILYIGFDHPHPKELTYINPDGTSYKHILYSGEELIKAEPIGTGIYHPRPKLQLHPLSHTAVGKRGPMRRLRNLYEQLYCRHSKWVVGLMAVLFIVLLFAAVIVALLGAWDFSETVFPYSIPNLAPFIFFAAIGLLLTLLNVTFKDYNLWWRFFHNTFATALVTGLLLTAVFTTNRLIPTADPVAGRGVVTQHVDNNGSHNYSIDVTAPVEGKIFFRMYNNSTLRRGDTVSLTLRRGLFGLYHTEKVRRLPSNQMSKVNAKHINTLCTI